MKENHINIKFQKTYFETVEICVKSPERANHRLWGYLELNNDNSIISF